MLLLISALTSKLRRNLEMIGYSGAIVCISHWFFLRINEKTQNNQNILNLII